MFAQLAKRAAPIAALAMGTTLSGCGLMMAEAWEDEEVRGVPLAELDMSGEAPDTIRLSGPDRVVITEGDSLAITLEGNSEAGDALRFDRDGDRLSIARDSEIYDGRSGAIVRMTMPAPDNLEIAGSGTIESTTLASEGELEIAGSGTITVTDIDAQRLDVGIAGSGNIRGTGSAQLLVVEIAGSGDVDLRELMADEVKVEIAGSGDVQLASNGTVDAEIAGSGDVTVTGSAICSIESVGSGKLTCNEGVQSAQAEATSDVDGDASGNTAAAED